MWLKFGNKFQKEKPSGAIVGVCYSHWKKRKACQQKNAVKEMSGKKHGSDDARAAWASGDIHS